jgi:hypothetical protein
MASAPHFAPCGKESATSNSDVEAAEVLSCSISTKYSSICKIFLAEMAGNFSFELW